MPDDAVRCVQVANWRNSFSCSLCRVRIPSLLLVGFLFQESADETTLDYGWQLGKDGEIVSGSPLWILIDLALAVHGRRSTR